MSLKPLTIALMMKQTVWQMHGRTDRHTDSKTPELENTINNFPAVGVGQNKSSFLKSKSTFSFHGLKVKPLRYKPHIVSSCSSSVRVG